MKTNICLHVKTDTSYPPPPHFQQFFFENLGNMRTVSFFKILKEHSRLHSPHQSLMIRWCGWGVGERLFFCPPTPPPSSSLCDVNISQQQNRFRRKEERGGEGRGEELLIAISKNKLIK